MSEEEVRLETLKFYQGQNRVVREVMDRWFRFYLLIIGAPFPVLLGLLQTSATSKSVQENPHYVAVIAIFLFMIGVLFLGAHIRQRITAVRLLRRSSAVEESVIHELAKGIPKLVGISEFGPERYGADFFVGLVYTFINSIWLAVGHYFYFHDCFNPVPRFVITILILIGTWTTQIFIRQRMLKEHERQN